MSDPRPLHERAPTTRFADRVRDYEKARPSYPSEAVDAILEDLPPKPICADIGAGTGIMSRLLAQRGALVHAIEPNQHMRTAGIRSSRALAERIRWHDATGEATSLPDAGVDLVVCAQSYHWLDPAPACREFARILRRPGRVALVWNDGDESTPVARAYYGLVRKASTEGTTAHQAAAHAPRVVAPLPAPRLRRFHHVHWLDEEGLIARALSASYVPRHGPPCERLQDALRTLARTHADDTGRVPFVYETLVWCCDLPA